MAPEPTGDRGDTEKRSGDHPAIADYHQHVATRLLNEGLNKSIITRKLRTPARPSGGLFTNSKTSPTMRSWELLSLSSV